MPYPLTAIRPHNHYRGIAAIATNWWLINSATRVHYAGLVAASFFNDAVLHANTTPTGITFLSSTPIERIMQDGLIRRISVYVRNWNTGTHWKFKVFRPNGSAYDFVSESEVVTPVSVGVQTFDLAQPMACQPGDLVGVWLDEGASTLSASNTGAALSVTYTTGDITSTGVTFGSVLGTYSINIEAFGMPPFLATTGDSIMSGNNVGGLWQAYFDGSGPKGTISADIAHQLRGVIGVTAGVGLEYQNLARFGQKWAWVESTGAPAALASSAKAILIHCGVNDVFAGTSWSSIQGSLNAIKALLGAGQRLFIDEILPWTAGDDAQAATLRTFNANLATWCAANSATLIACHDALGQNRVSTGQLDDLLTAYNQDGVHLTQAGVDKLATLIAASLSAYYGP